jgi:hypothetical protein
MPGIGELIEGAMQQAAQRGRHSMDRDLRSVGGIFGRAG